MSDKFFAALANLDARLHFSEAARVRSFERERVISEILAMQWSREQLPIVANIIAKIASLK